MSNNMSNNYVLSIGLNVGATEPAEQLMRTLRATCLYVVPHAVAMGSSEWEGTPERFAQFLVRDTSPDSVAAAAHALAQYLDQDAVAFTTVGGASWMLAHADRRISDGGKVSEFPIIVKG